jgi:hypothetical protein
VNFSPGRRGWQRTEAALEARSLLSEEQGMDLVDGSWIELVRLSTLIAELESQQQAALALKHFGALKAIQNELAETEERRERILSDLAQSVVE